MQPVISINVRYGFRQKKSFVSSNPVDKAFQRMTPERVDLELVIFEAFLSLSFVFLGCLDFLWLADSRLPIGHVALPGWSGEQMVESAGFRSSNFASAFCNVSFHRLLVLSFLVVTILCPAFQNL